MSKDKNHTNRTHRKTAARKLQNEAGISYQTALNQVIKAATSSQPPTPRAQAPTHDWILIARKPHQGKPWARVTPQGELRTDYYQDMNHRGTRPDYDIALDAGQNPRIVTDAELDIDIDLSDGLGDMYLAELADLLLDALTLTDDSWVIRDIEPDACVRDNIYQAVIWVQRGDDKPIAIYAQCDGDPSQPSHEPGLDTYQQWLADDAQHGAAAYIPFAKPETRNGFMHLLDSSSGRETDLYECIAQTLICHYSTEQLTPALANIDNIYPIELDAHAFVTRMLTANPAFVDDFLACRNGPQFFAAIGDYLTNIDPDDLVLDNYFNGNQARSAMLYFRATGRNVYELPEAELEDWLQSLPARDSWLYFEVATNPWENYSLDQVGGTRYTEFWLDLSDSSLTVEIARNAGDAQSAEEYCGVIRKFGKLPPLTPQTYAALVDEYHTLFQTILDGSSITEGTSTTGWGQLNDSAAAAAAELNDVLAQEAQDVNENECVSSFSAEEWFSESTDRVFADRPYQHVVFPKIDSFPIGEVDDAAFLTTWMAITNEQIADVDETENLLAADTMPGVVRVDGIGDYLEQLRDSARDLLDEISNE